MAYATTIFPMMFPSMFYLCCIRWSYVCVGVLVDHGSPTIGKSHWANYQEMDCTECPLFHVVGIPAHSLSLFCADNMLGRQKLGIYLRRMRENVCSIPNVLSYCIVWVDSISKILYLILIILLPIWLPKPPIHRCMWISHHWCLYGFWSINYYDPIMV